jgi:hypothetical protein
MEVSQPRKAISLEISVWYDTYHDQILLAASEVHRFTTTVNRDPRSKRGHSDLFAKLAKALKEAGAPHPQLVEDAYFPRL